MEEITEVDEIFLEHSYEKYCNEFGAPRQVAARLIDGANAAELKQYKYKQKLRVILFVFLLSLSIFVLALLYYQQVKINPNEEGVVTYTIYPEEKMNQGEEND